MSCHFPDEPEVFLDSKPYGGNEKEIDDNFLKDEKRKKKI
jgi:hypothetical protein